MRTPQETKPVDVSKSLFMDLAFLLIAALVLLVQEPSKQRPQDEQLEVETQHDRLSLVATQLRTITARAVVEADIPGESVFLQICTDGTISEVETDGRLTHRTVPELPERILAMSSIGKRVVVLMPEHDVPYAKVAEVRDVLTQLQLEEKLTEIYELSHLEE